MTGAFVSVPRYDWCTLLSQPFFCVLTADLQRRICMSHGSGVLLPNTMHLIQRPCYQRGSLRQDPAGNWPTWRPDHRKETQTEVVWTWLLFIRYSQNHLARHSERGKKTRQTEKEVGRQHQGMDRPGICQVQEGSAEQWKLVVESSVVPQWPSRLRNRWYMEL